MLRITASFPRPSGLAILLVAGLGAACQSRPATQAAPAVTADTWAVVDGRQITRMDVDKAFERNRDPGQAMSEEETLAAKLGLLDDLITQDLLIARARVLMIEVPEAEIDKAYQDAKKNIPDEAFQQELTKRNLTTSDMRESLRRQLISQKVLERDVTGKVSISDKEVTDFFNANRAQFNLPEDAFQLAQLVVTPVRDPQIANRSGDDATTPAAMNTKIQMLMQRLQQGASFGEMAMDFSEDPETAPRGGDLGLVPISAVQRAPPELRDAVLGMQPGRARIVNQGGAQTIVLLVARETAGQRDLSTPGTRDQITNALKGRKEQLLRTAYLTSMRTKADVTNYLAQRLVESNGAPPGAPPAVPGAPPR
jgi:peptidyl-prolyl cis-trans isomerase SurA